MTTTLLALLSARILVVVLICSRTSIGIRPHNYMKLQIFCGLHGVRIENIKKIFVLGLGFGDADLGYIKHLIYETQGISENPETYLEQEEKAYLDSLDSDGIMHINMQYAFSHRERVMQKKPISFSRV